LRDSKNTINVRAGGSKGSKWSTNGAEGGEGRKKGEDVFGRHVGSKIGESMKENGVEKVSRGGGGQQKEWGARGSRCGRAAGERGKKRGVNLYLKAYDGSKKTDVKTVSPKMQGDGEEGA